MSSLAAPGANSLVIVDPNLTELQVMALAEILMEGTALPTPAGRTVAADLEGRGLIVSGPDRSVSVTTAGAERLRSAVSVPAFIGHCHHCGGHFKVADLPGEAETIGRQMREAVRNGCPECGDGNDIYLSQRPTATAWWVVRGRLLPGIGARC